MIVVIDTRKLVPTIYQKVLYYALLPQRVYKDFILKGGRGSLKSTIAALIVVLTVYLNLGSAICVRLYKTDLRKSCRATVIQTIKRLKIEKFFEWSDAPNGILTVKCTLTGKVIEFVGLDDADKLKSYADDGGVGCLWVEECQMIQTMKKIDNIQQTFDRGTNNVIFIFCYNPKPIKKHWCNTELLVPHSRKLILHTSYLDVPPSFLGKGFIERAENLKNRNYEQYLNEYMGEVVGSTGKVFRNIKDISVKDILKIKSDAEYIERGLDLGFSSAGDPTAYTGWVVKKSNEKIDLYCVFEHVQHSMKIPELAKVIKEHNKYNSIVYSDTLPVVVDSLVDDFDLNVEVAYKHNLRDIGFHWLSTEVDNIFICEELTPKTYEEFTNYVFKENKAGEIDLSIYPKENDHTIDSCRYALQEYIKGESK